MLPHLRRLRPLFVRVAFTLSILNLQGCTYISAISLTNIPAQRQNKVSASVKKLVFLGLSFDNDKVFTLSQKLRSECAGGEVKGIFTKDLRTLYFLDFIMSQETVATGYCVKPSEKFTKRSVDGFEIENSTAGTLASLIGQDADEDQSLAPADGDDEGVDP